MIEQTVLIRRPILDVFDYLMNVENFWRWAPYLLKTSVTERDSQGWPSRFRARVGFTLAASYETEVMVSDVHRGRWITYRSIDPPQLATYSLEPSSAGTLLIAKHSPWVLPGIDSFGSTIEAVSLSYLHQGLTNLKTLVEARPMSAPPVVFLSYRREGAGYVVGRVVERLSREFGERSVFRDISSIYVGGNWMGSITAAIESCAAALILVNDGWVEALASRKDSKRRDVLRLEVTAALGSHKLVLPVALEGVDIDRVLEKLPEDLLKLRGLQWQRLRHDPEFDADVARIVESIWAEVMERGPADVSQDDTPPGDSEPQMQRGFDIMSTWSQGVLAMIEQWGRRF